MATPVTGIRIPAELLSRIDDRAIDGKTRTDAILELIRLGLGDPLPITDGDRLTGIEDRLTAVEQAVEQLTPKRPSQDALKGGSRESAVHLDVTSDKATCPACGLKLTRKEGRGKVWKTGENAGKRQQRWRCLNPECDRFGRDFSSGWAD